MPYRPLQTNERALLEKLLEPDFPGRNELLGQLRLATADPIDEDGSRILSCGPCLPATVNFRVPTEGECPDADGVTIHILLHVVNGVMRALEVFKDDASKVCHLPAAADLEVFTPG